MLIFNILWNLSLGIIGGIVSSVIVSRVFLIQGDYRNQVTQFEQLLRKLGYMDGMFFGVKTVLEFSYDSDAKMQQEMERYGYKTEAEYYAAHKECRWISKDNLIKDMLGEIRRMGDAAKKEIINTQIAEEKLRQIANDFSDYIHDVIELKECSFASIHTIERKSATIQMEFENYKKGTTKLLLKMILTDKVMVVLYFFVVLVFIGAFITFQFGV